MAFDVVTYALCKANDGQIWEYVKSMEKLTIVVADEVPTVETAEPNKLYLVDTNHDGVYEEYVLAEVDGEPEILELGNITDLSNYYTKSEADALFDDKENYIEVLSQADYNQLTPAQIAEDRAYMVIIDNTHGEFYKQGRLYGTTTAPHILYDNTTSGLTATNVQDAIDEVYSSITIPDADDIPYDNTASGMSATNVQDAIDEVVSSMDDVHVSLTEAEYNALTPQEQNNGTEYFVEGPSRDMIWTDTNGHIVTIEIIGWVADQYYYTNHVTTQPTLSNTGANRWLLFKTTSSEGVFYHCDLALPSGAQSNVGLTSFTPWADTSNLYAKNIYFVPQDATQFKLASAEGSLTPETFHVWVSLSNYSLEASSRNYIYRNKKKYADTNPPALDVSYVNTISHIEAENVQDALDEIATAVTNIDAGDVAYDNTTSGTTATNVQDALDELAASAGATHVDLTQAEYNQLTPAEQNDGTEYFITDAQINMDYSSLENRILKMEGNFINVSPNLQMLNPAAYKQVTKVSDNEVYFIVTDPITHIDYKVTVTATGTGDTRTNPQYTIQQVVGQ